MEGQGVYIMAPGVRLGHPQCHLVSRQAEWGGMGMATSAAELLRRVQPSNRTLLLPGATTESAPPEPPVLCSSMVAERLACMPASCTAPVRLPSFRLNWQLCAAKEPPRAPTASKAAPRWPVQRKNRVPTSCMSVSWAWSPPPPTLAAPPLTVTLSMRRVTRGVSGEKYTVVVERAPPEPEEQLWKITSVRRKPPF